MAGVDRGGRGARRQRLPNWADVTLVPLISVLIAFAISALVILAIGEDPWEATRLMVQGALGSTYGWGYTLYYATNFMFTGLAVAVAFQARLFNIGGEGQALAGRARRRAGLPVRALAALVDALVPRRSLGASRSSARPGRRSRPICRPSAAATS
jgi:hypothetical protein